MRIEWDDSRRAFADAADWFVATARQVGDRWTDPGLGEWDVRALVGHASRSLLTVEAYLATPAEAVAVQRPADYYRVARPIAAGPEVAQRGRDAGAALGDDPAAAVAEIAARVVPLVEARTGAELVTTIVGGMRLADYLPTRTVELAVHTCDLAVAFDLPLAVPASAASEALAVLAEVAVEDDASGALLLALTGRRRLPVGFTVV
ncbi:MAG: maleylpyruvate isomerase N-terminal domain-containing protein [Nocardioides sp.]